MKRASVMFVALLVFAAFAMMPTAAFAGPGCSAKKVDAKMIQAGGAVKCDHVCTDDCDKDCKIAGAKCEMVSMSIEGMTCGGCEKSLETMLSEIDGVLKVKSISHKTGQALVCIDASKVKQSMLTTALVNKGYKAEIIPAVATTATTVNATTVGAKKACGFDKAACADKTAGEKAGCSKACAKTCGDKAKKTEDAAAGSTL
ncbi:MAG: cation transporter [candidate division Zixibacteria bacterium]